MGKMKELAIERANQEQYDHSYQLYLEHMHGVAMSKDRLPPPSASDVLKEGFDALAKSYKDYGKTPSTEQR